jgi:hypothetical protein
MSKMSGLGSNLYVDGYNISGDTQAIGRMNGGPSVIVTTGIDKEAPERIGGKRDGNLDATTYWNPDTDHSNLVLEPMPLTDRIISYFHVPSGETFSLMAKQGSYDPTLANDGSLTCAVTSMANGYGAEWGNMLTDGPDTHTSATNGTSLDTLASASFGAQAWLHVFAFAGTDVTVKLQDSADNASWADLTAGAFTQITTAPGAQRIQTARNATIRRYLRAVTVTSGGFTSLTFAVSVTKNQTTVNY